MRYGITGGIGSGKSYICDMLRKHGYQVYNCDNEAKRLMVTDNDIISGMRSLVGDDAYNADGTLNKPVIANFLFSDSANGDKVNAIVHPAVRKDFLRWANDVEQGSSEWKKIPIMECAILFESGFDSVVDKTVLICAEEGTRLQRAMERDHATKEQILARMSAQISGKEAKKRADYIFDNEDYSNTEDELKKLLHYIEHTN